MKTPTFYFIFLWMLNCQFIQAQTWTQLSNLPFQTVRDTGFNAHYGTGFVIGSTIYYLPVDTSTLWAYNTLTNTWTPKAPFPQGIRVNASSFAIDSIGFITCGRNLSTSLGVKSDLWRYSPATDTWTQKASIQTSTYTREYCVSFVINNLGYLATGKSPNVPALTPYISQLQEYNPATDVWTIKTSVPDVNNPPFKSNGRGYAAGFAFDGKGYVVSGLGNGSLLTDTRQYNPTTNTWASISTPFGAIVGGTSITAMNRGFVCFGQAGVGVTSMGSIWQLDSTLVWSLKSSFPGPSRKFATGFTVGCNTYVLGGQNYNTANTPAVTNLVDFWKSTCNTLPVELIGFDVICQEKDNERMLVNWATASEINVKSFLIRIGSDQQYQTKRIPASGNSNIKRNYTVKFSEADIDINYANRIQLLEVDYDNQETMLIDQAFTCKSNQYPGLLIFPNPSVLGYFNLFEPNFNANDLSVFDQLGKTVKFVLDESDLIVKLHLEGENSFGIFYIQYQGRHYKVIHLP